MKRIIFCKRSLNAGKHVVVENLYCYSTEAEELIALAKAKIKYSRYFKADALMVILKQCRT